MKQPFSNSVAQLTQLGTLCLTRVPITFLLIHNLDIEMPLHKLHVYFQPSPQLTLLIRLLCFLLLFLVIELFSYLTETLISKCYSQSVPPKFQESIKAKSPLKASLAVKIVLYLAFVGIIFTLPSTNLPDNLKAMTLQSEHRRMLKTLDSQYADSIGSIPIGNAYTIVESNNIAFVNADPGLLIIDFSYNPTTLGTLTIPGTINTDSKMLLSSNGNFIVCSNPKTGIFIIDVTIHNSPSILATITPTNGVKAIALHPSDDYLYAGTNQELIIYDISTRSSPTQVNIVSSGLNYNDMKMNGTSYLLCIVQYRGLHVYNLAMAYSLSLTYSQAGSDTLAASKKLAVTPDGTIAYIFNPGVSLYIMNLTDYTTPSLIATTGAFYGYAMTISKDGKALYFPYGNNGLSIYDISTPTTPTKKGFLFSGDDITYVTEVNSDQFLSVSPTYTFNIYNIKELYMYNTIPGPVSYINQFSTGEYSDLKVVNHYGSTYLLAGHNPGGYKLFSIYNSKSPSLMATGNIINAKNAKVSSANYYYDYMNFWHQDHQLVYVIGYGGNLTCVDTSYSPQPDTYWTPSSQLITDVAVSVDKVNVYVLESGVGIHVFFANNTNSLNYTGTVNNSLADSSLLYITSPYEMLVYATSANTMCFYNITNNGSLPYLITCVPGGYPKDYFGSYLAACTTNGMTIYDISKLPTVTQTSYIQTLDCRDIKFTGTQALVADYQAGLKYIDVQDMYNPFIISAYLTSSAVAVENLGSVVYVANEKDYLTVFDVSSKIYIPVVRTHGLGTTYSTTLTIYQPDISYYTYSYTYHPFKDYYKFAAFLVSTTDYLSDTTYQSTPSWMTFLPNYGTLTIAPVSASDVGNYTIYVSIATLIPKNIFNGVGSITTDAQSQDLCAELVKTGYLDTEYYLTSKFIPSKTLVLSSTYASDEPLYKNILINYYYETFLYFEIKSSLNITSSPGSTTLAFSSISKSVIKVTIDITSGKMVVPFDLAATATVSNNGQTLTISGFAADIGAVMSNQLYIFSSGTQINGTITVNDQLNPITKYNLTNIDQYMKIYSAPILNNIGEFINGTKLIPMGTYSFSMPADFYKDINVFSFPVSPLSYKLYQVLGGNQTAIPSFITFDQDKLLIKIESNINNTNYDPVNKAYSRDIILRFTATNSGGVSTNFDFTLSILNKAPILNYPIQTQVHKLSFISGSMFTFKIADNTFIDPANSPLTYTLTDTKGNSPPEWVQFKDLTISGSPDDSSWFTMDLVLTASNKVQSASDTFRIYFRPSVGYILNQLLAWGGSLLGIIGMYAYLPIAYNILLKKRYNYPRKFFVEFQEEIDPSQIFSIVFVKGLKAQAWKMMLKLKIKNWREHGRKKHVLDDYFDRDTQTIDESKVTAAIDHYFPNLYPKKRAVLIIILKDMMTLQQIERKVNKKTNDIFKKIKPNWVNMVHYEDSKETDNAMLRAFNSYKLDYGKLESYINGKVPQNTASVHPDSSLVINHTVNNTVIHDLESDSSVIHMNQQPSLKVKPSFNPEIKLPLLQAAVMAHFRTKQSIDYNLYEASITGGVVETKSKIMKFLKLGVLQTGEGGDLGVGIETKTDFDTLTFGGSPQEAINTNDFVVRITSRYGLIMREFYIQKNPNPKPLAEQIEKEK